MAFSAAAPATQDQLGYEAVSYTDSGEVITIGAVGPENEVLTFQTVCDGKINKRMGAANYGSQSLELAFDAANGAQQILETAAADRTPVTVRETLSSGDVLYYIAYVASFKTDPSSQILRATVTLEVDSTITRV